ncbi:MAG: NAD(P)-dependent oxidoreductase, partial [Planctomycetota bacterium]
MRVLITGTAGKIGRVVGRELHEHGHDVLGVDRGFRPDVPYEQRVGDLLEPFFFERVFEKDGSFDAIVHLANIPNVRAGRTPAAVLSENLAMSGLVFGVARERGVKRILYSSSIQAALPAYDDDGQVIHETPPECLPIDETVSPRPSNMYGLSKLVAEQML